VFRARSKYIDGRDARKILICLDCFRGKRK